MGIFLSSFVLISIAVAEPAPPNAAVLIKLRTGSEITVRVVTSHPFGVSHQLVSPREQVGPGVLAVKGAIKDMFASLIDLSISAHDRTGLIVLPEGLDIQTACQWIAEGVVIGARALPEAPSFHIHLTLKTEPGFTAENLVQAFSGVMRDFAPLVKRLQFASALNPIGLDWATFPPNASLPLLPAPAPETVEAARPIWQEVQRLEAEWQSWSEFFGERIQPLSKDDRTQLLAAIRDLPKAGRAEVRATIAQLRLEIANHLTIDPDPLTSLMAAVGRIQKRCSRSLESS